MSALLLARFWSKVEVGADDECWPWRRALDRYGYGQFKVPGERAPQRAHRVAWTLFHGPIGARVQILHGCDNPACCNPGHMHRGDHPLNMAEKAARGRSLKGQPRGSTLAATSSRSPA